jgi:cell wall-associated NlpC family hydrolase
MVGKPYVWGGGGIHGPTKGGFDCSGLTQYSVYTAQKKTIRKLITPLLRCSSRVRLTNRLVIARTAQTQYHSKLGKHIPRAQAKAGDLLFWGKNGNCNTGVVHVGIFTKPGWMVNAAHTGVPVRNQKIWTSYGGEKICPDAVRFW